MLTVYCVWDYNFVEQAPVQATSPQAAIARAKLNDVIGPMVQSMSSFLKQKGDDEIF